MISVFEAKKIIAENCNTQRVEARVLSKSQGYILAKTVYAPVDTPPFHQSAMDGYAFSYESWDGKTELEVCGEIQAGNDDAIEIKSFQAVRIFTGAAVPTGADTVVIQEHVTKNENRIHIENTRLAKGDNVRLRGSQTKKDEPALDKEQLLTAPAISFLAGMGIEKVEVFSKPVVSIIVTSKELIPPGGEITEGKIYESNSFGLTAGLGAMGITPISVEMVDDVEEEIINAITKQLTIDILILTGGVSVGDYDLVPKTLERCGVKNIFHNVKQKPGKPIYFGKRNHTLVFGLPGNPASVLTCFYEYVIPAISLFTKRQYSKKIKMPLANEYKKKAGLTFFLKGKTNEEGVAILNNQASYLMNSFAIADCIIELEEEKEQFMKGEMVDVLMIV
ncbi:MAG TPA: molybdopterin molybdotransferase MoeA [Hanamia sp.]|nr:molybdopterin molybdotransferase MoeA [Hanamia sp.]